MAPARNATAQASNKSLGVNLGSFISQSLRSVQYLQLPLWAKAPA